MQEVDPDIITGYNIINFDIPYLLNRAKALKVRYIHVQCSFFVPSMYGHTVHVRFIQDFTQEGANA